MSSDQLAAAFGQAMKAKLAFRRDDFARMLMAVVSAAASAGRFRSSATPVQVGQVFRDEARAAAEMIVAELRTQRVSWPPAELARHTAALRESVSAALREHLHSIADRASDSIKSLRERGWADHFDTMIEEGTAQSLSWADAIVTEACTAARIQADDPMPAGRPLIYQPINGPVGFIAQGEARVSRLQQKVGSSSLTEVAAAFQQMLTTMEAAKLPASSIGPLREALPEVQQGKIPSWLPKTLDLLVRAEDALSKAPKAVEAVQHFLQLIGLR